MNALAGLAWYLPIGTTKGVLCNVMILNALKKWLAVGLLITTGLIGSSVAFASGRYAGGQDDRWWEKRKPNKEEAKEFRRQEREEEKEIRKLDKKHQLRYHRENNVRLVGYYDSSGSFHRYGYYDRWGYFHKD